MSTKLEEKKLSMAKEYQVISVEETQPPEGMPEGTWYRYVIGRDQSEIEGLRPGSLSTVTEHAESVAEDLNSRTYKSGSTYAARNRR